MRRISQTLSGENLKTLQQTLERAGWRVRFDGNELALSSPAP